MKLTADNVHSTFLSCLFKDGEDTSNHVRVSGILGDFGFHPERLESHREDVRTMLADLSDDFHSDKGGGMSFLNACMTGDGDHWGEHPTMNELFCLGIGLGIARFLMPREMWSVFPGGMPYVSVDVNAPVATE